MELVERIREYYATILESKIRLIDGLPNDFPAYVFKHANEYGVCIPFDNLYDFSEDFTSSKIRTIDLVFEGSKTRVLFLSSRNILLREQFSIISANFIEPGDNGEKRKELVKDPEKWVLSWIDLLGNAKKHKNSFSVLGELYSLKYLYKIDKKVVWTGAFQGTHDLESDDVSYEVKSTKMRYDSYITVSSHNQLYSDKQIKLVFIRMEKTPHGISINSIVKDLVDDGYDLVELEKGLSKEGLYLTKRQRNEKYTILESNIYAIDESFPRMDMNNISNVSNKDHIIKITYTIDLTGLVFHKLV